MAISLPCTCYECATRQQARPTQSLRYQPRHEYQYQQHQNFTQYKDLYRHMLSRYPPRLPGRNWIDRLPQDILSRVCRFLDYQSLLFLRQASRRTYQLVEPQASPWQDRFALVARAERDFSHNIKAGRFACYACFTCYTKDHFARDQPLQIVRPGMSPNRPPEYARRFCMACGVREGFHQVGERLKTESKTFWVCGCKQIRDQSLLKCEYCQRSAPLSDPETIFNERR